MLAAASAIVSALCYAIKGGSLGEVIKKWNDIRESNKVLDFIMDGKVLSTILFGLATGAFLMDAVLGFSFALAWLVSMAPSMGEEHGAIGDHKGPLPVYLERSVTHRGPKYDVKKALQRGVFTGAVFTAFTGFVPYIFASLLFVPSVFVGQSIHRLIKKEPGWTLAEPLIGLTVVGLPTAAFIYLTNLGELDKWNYTLSQLLGQLLQLAQS